MFSDTLLSQYHKVSSTYFSLFWGFLTVLALTLAVLDNWCHEAGYELGSVKTVFFYLSKSMFRGKVAELLIKPISGM